MPMSNRGHNAAVKGVREDFYILAKEIINRAGA
jgi:hypothetical protein